MKFGILGPLWSETGSAQIALAPRERVLLTVLLLQVNHTVSRERITDALWADQPPRDTTSQVHGSIHRLRKQLAAAGMPKSIIATDQAGYRVELDPADLDLTQFRELRDQARSAAAAGDLTVAKTRYRAALSLWRGPALDGVRSDALRETAASLDEEHVQAREECLEVELALGKAGELVSELTEMVSQHPYRERLHKALMLALYRAGRQADALAAYQRVRRLLRDDLGAEPGAELQELHRAILGHDPDLRTPPPAASPQDRSAPPRPRELPADVAGFTGRVEALKDLDAMLANTPGGPPGALVISAITGTAGIGKTALAIHWAHRIAEHFPDGQLHVNLRGYATKAPLRPIEALTALLRSLGTPPNQIPTEETQAAGLYRTKLAERRMLVLLDNAGSVEQVRPLLPGSPGSLVVVTSRSRLTGLVARDGARRLTLDVLTADEAYTLLATLLGSQRVEAEPYAVTDLAAACAFLPLALRIAAAHIVDHPARTIAAYIDQLTSGDRLAALRTHGDEESSILAALDLSYRTLPTDTARLFRLLGLHPGLDVDLYAAAALADTTAGQAVRLLDQLLDAHLLQESTHGRYLFHDMVRAYATRTAATTDTELDRRAALSRLLGHYQHAASVAIDTVYPYDRDRRPRVPVADSPTPDLSDPTHSTEWLDAELPNLLAVARQAADSGWPEPTLHLSATLTRHLHTRGRNHDAETLHRQALTIALAAGHRPAELAALIGLGDIHRLQGRHEQAVGHYRPALEIARAIGNRTGEVDTLIGLGDVYVLQGQHERAIDHFGQALEIARATGNRTGELDALTGLGWGHEWQGLYEQARDHYRPALEIARATGNRTGELEALTSLGHIHRLQGRHEQALDHFEQVLKIARATNHRPAELAALTGLADIHRLQGQHERAIDHFGHALEIARATDHRTGELSALRGLAYIHRRQGRHEQAKDRYQQVLDIAREIGDRNWQFEALQGLGRTHHAMDQQEQALVHYQLALKFATDLGQPADQARAHDGIAHAHHALHQDRHARQHWQRAMDILVSLGTDHTDDEEATVPNIRARLDQQQEPPVEPA